MFAVEQRPIRGGKTVNKSSLYRHKSHFLLETYFDLVNEEKALN